MSRVEKKICINANALFSQMPDVASRQVSTTKLQKRSSRKKPLKAIPVRQTLTSRLRMKNATSLVSSNAFDKVDKGHPTSSSTAKNPVRKSSFHKDIMKEKQTLEFTATSSSFKRPHTSNQKKNIGKGSFKENKPLPVHTLDKIRVLQDNSGVLVSKISRRSTAYKSRFAFFNKKNALSTQNQSKSVRIQNKNNQLQPLSKTTPVSCHRDNCFKSRRNTPSKENASNNSKRRAPKSTKATIKNTSNCFPVQISHSEVQSCNSLAADNIKGEGLKKEERKVEEPILVSRSKDQLSQTSYLQDRSNSTRVVYDSRVNNSTTIASKKATSISSDSIKRVEEWLKSRKSAHHYDHLYCPKIPEEYSVLKSRNDQTRSNLDKAVTLENRYYIDTFSRLKTSNNCCNGKSNFLQGAAANTQENLNQSKIGYGLKSFSHSNYFRDEREQCLALSTSRPSVKDLAKYWEHVTNLHNARREFSAAVDCYGRDILMGTDAEINERKLDELEGKFRALRTSLRDEEEDRNLTDNTIMKHRPVNMKCFLEQEAGKESWISKKACRCPYCS